MKLGDTIASVATPIARGIDAVAGTHIAGCSGCNKMRQNLNAGMSVTDAIYQRWFAAKQQGEKTMTYQVIVLVEADNLKQAIEKVDPVGEVLSIQARPQPVQRP